MYMGIQSHRGLKARSYEDAVKLHAAQGLTPTGRTRKPIALYSAGVDSAYPLGLTKRGQTMVIRYHDGVIAFRLYETDVVSWHPDNSVVIENFGTVTTSDFASGFLPAYISLRRPSCTRGHDGGDKGITYYAPGGDRWADRMIVSGDAVRFVEQDGAWVPDLETCDDMQFLELDRKASRGLAARLHLADFANWLSMAPRHLDIEHTGFCLDDCVDALERRDFRAAAEALPTVTIPNGWNADRNIKPLPISVRNRDNPVTMGSIGKLKLAVWNDEGMLTSVKLKTLPLREYDRRMARIKELVLLDVVDVDDYGASR